MGRPVILQKYPYTYLRTIIMKKNLLTKTDYDKILKMTPTEIGKYLEDFEYKKEVDELAMKYKGVELMERTLQLNLGNVFDKLMKISPHDLRLLISVYLKRYDIYNIKNIIRSKFSGLSAEEEKEHLSPISTESKSFFENLSSHKTVEEVFSSLNFLEEKDVRAALDHFKTSKSLVLIENTLDKYYYNFVFSQLRYLNMEGRRYKKFMLNEIDVLNVKLILRLKQEKVPEQNIKELVFNLGTLKILDKLIKSDINGILKELEGTEFKEAIKQDSENINFTDLEINLDRFLLQESKKLIKQHPMGVDVILGYMFLKDLEVKNLSRIIKAKQLGLEEDFIQKVIVW